MKAQGIEKVHNPMRPRAPKILYRVRCVVCKDTKIQRGPGPQVTVDGITGRACFDCILKLHAAAREETTR